MAARVHALARSPWVVPLTLAAGWLAGTLVAGLLVGLLAIAGLGGDLTPASALVASLAVACGLVGAALMATPAPGRLQALGLRPVRPAAGLAWAALAVLVVGAFAFLLTQLVDIRDTLALPEELDSTTWFEKELGAADDTESPGLTLGVAVSALAHVVIVAVAAELVLRGFVLSALAKRPGLWLAVPVSAFLYGAPMAYAAGAGEEALAPLALVVGLALCGLYWATGSLYPGIGVSALALGTLFGSALGWDLGEALGLAAACAAAALLLPWLAARRERIVGEAGQITTEMMGVMLVIAGIVGVVATSGIGERIAAGVRDQVCDVLGESCAREPEARPARTRDSDDDGLTDRRERRLGTRPARSDTDYDGVADGEEVRRGTDPRKGDRRL
jgi:membrane protease YdiL (CAAX protease family)